MAEDLRKEWMGVRIINAAGHEAVVLNAWQTLEGVLMFFVEQDGGTTATVPSKLWTRKDLK